MEFTLTIEQASASLVATDADGGVLGYMVLVDVHGEGWIVEHTIVEERGQGKGTGKALLEELKRCATEDARYIVPICPFVYGQFTKYPDVAIGRAVRAEVV